MGLLDDQNGQGAALGDLLSPIAAAPAAREPRKPKQYRWDFRPENSAGAQALLQAMRMSPVVARVVANRGIADCPDALQTFMRPALAQLHDPFKMAGMQAAVDRLLVAREKNEQVTVYGDYDTDGSTSTSLLLRTFRHVGIRADYYIPHRMTEGYGLHHAAIEKLAALGTKLLVTVDTGVSGHEQVARAQELGMDVIVTDHHQATTILPAAVAVVNPNRHDCTYPNKYLTGVGVAFKLAHGLLRGVKHPPHEATAFLRSLLDLVAIGTVADFAPLVGENRILVSHGLDQIARTTNPGVAEMKRLLQMGDSRPTAHHIGFQIAPRLNAAGRTSHAGICVELLTTDCRRTAADIAEKLDVFNKERRTVESHIFDQCLRFVDQHIDLNRDRIVVVNGQDWHVGVIGIVASKIMDLVDRPVIILSEQKGSAKGSARSIRSFNIHQALQACQEHLTTFGGHPNAAGLQMDCVNIAAFRDAINLYAGTTLADEDMKPVLTIDTEVNGHELDDMLMRDLAMLEPYGQSNPPPMLAVRNLRLADNPRVVGTNHLKLQFKYADGRPLSGIAFNMGALKSELSNSRGAYLDVAFVPTVNTYWAQPRVELEVKDLRIHPAN